jgi:hypothetical protein
MNYITCVIKNREGIGSLFQYILSCYFISKIHNLKFVYTPINNIEHMIWDGYDSQEKWDEMWNNYIVTVFLPKDDVILINNLNKDIKIINNSLDFNKYENTLFVLDTFYIGKSYLDNNLNIHTNIMEKLIINYINNNNIISYYDKNKINIGVHIRRYTQTDCDPGAPRELYLKGGETDLYFYSLILKLLELLKSKNRKIEVHIYSQISKNEENDIFDHYFNFQNENVKIILHKGDNTVSDLYHMINSDILLLSKSSFSAIANYYSKGICIIKNSFWHTLKNNTIYIDSSNIKFNNQQEKYILNNIL